MAQEPRSRTRLKVEEQTDMEGDLVFAITLRTYSRPAVAEMARVFGVEIDWVTDAEGVLTASMYPATQ